MIVVEILRKDAALENAPIGPVPGSLGLEDGKDVEKSTRIDTLSWTIMSRPPSTEEIAVIGEFLDLQQRGDPESENLARQQRAEIETARSRVAAIEKEIMQAREQAKQKVLAGTADYLATVATLSEKKENTDLRAVAAGHDLDHEMLRRWQAVTQGDVARLPLVQLLEKKVNSIAGNKLLLGWGSNAPPWLGVNSHDEPAKNAGFSVPSRALAMHPSQNKRIALGWQSPVRSRVRISLGMFEGQGGGNGVDWALVHRQSSGERLLKAGYLQSGRSFPIVAELDVRPGEFISLLIGPHEHQHGSDTTVCDLTIEETGGKRRTWNAARQLLNRIHDGNPLADIWGSPSVWRFYTISDRDEEPKFVVPSASALGRWLDGLRAQSERKKLDQLRLAVEQVLLSQEDSLDDADKLLRERLLSPYGPLFVGFDAPLGTKSKARVAILRNELGALGPLAAKPLPPRPVGSEKRLQESLRQMVWAMLMSSEFRFNH